VTAALLRMNRRTFASLRHHRNYRLFFAGQGVSVVGTWVQRIAQAWLVLQLTHSAVAVGILALAQFLPFSVFGLFAGVVVDRFDPRRLVIGTQIGLMLVSASLATIALSGVARPWHVYAIAGLNGMLMVLDAPARQALTYRMVGRDQLQNAVALNSSLFNAARIFGPAVGGVVIALVGPGICFAINAGSFLAVIGALLSLRTKEFFPLERRERPQILRGTREGLAFVWHDRRLTTVLALTLVVSTFCVNFNVLLPLLAKRTLHAGPQTFGVLSALFGAGALVGALIAASRQRTSVRALLLGAAVFAGSQLALAPLHSAPPAALLLFLGGIGFTVWTATSNTLLQLAAPDHLRGRVVGLYFYAFTGTAAFGGILMGWLTAHGGTELAFAFSGTTGLVGVAAACAGLRRRPPAAAAAPSAVLAETARAA
jgi:MFS family permease